MELNYIKNKVLSIKTVISFIHLKNIETQGQMQTQWNFVLSEVRKIK